LRKKLNKLSQNLKKYLSRGLNNSLSFSLLEGVGSVGLEHLSVSALTGSAGSSENWELKTVFSEQV
jgi:hypothetical protein